jgi:hypothetical protein
MRPRPTLWRSFMSNVTFEVVFALSPSTLAASRPLRTTPRVNVAESHELLIRS